MTYARFFALAVTGAVAGSRLAAADVFYQPFDIADPANPRPGCNIGDFPGGPGTYPYPAGWLKFDVDGRTPAPEVSYVNEAWEVREDFGRDSSQCAAFSTSYYSPPGQADDWTWTPAIDLPPGTSTLSWRAVTYDPAFQDGYEVRIKEGALPPTVGTLTSSSILFSTPAEASSWTVHSVSLAGYGGHTVYIAFRNNSTDKFLLLIDDVRIQDSTPDLFVAAPTAISPYPRAPTGVDVDASASARASNFGGSALTNIAGTATMQRDGANAAPPLLAPTLPTLSIGASAPLTFAAPPALAGDGVWRYHYEATADETSSEVNVANNAADSLATSIGGNEFARHDVGLVGTLGIGAGNGGEMGVQFTLTNAARFEGIRFDMYSFAPPTPGDPEWAGQTVKANLRTFDSGTNKPGALITDTVGIISTDAGGRYDVAFSAGPQTLAAGTYVVTVSEPVGGSAMPLELSATRFTPATTWVTWPSSPFGDWANLEAFGTNFMRVPHVSLLSELSLFKHGFEDQSAPTAALLRAPSRPLRNGPPPKQLAKPAMN